MPEDRRRGGDPHPTRQLPHRPDRHADADFHADRHRHPDPHRVADLTVKRIEVLQATQDENNTIPLVQDKFTVARVFVDIGDVDYDRMTGVSAEITGYRGGVCCRTARFDPGTRGRS